MPISFLVTAATAIALAGVPAPQSRDSLFSRVPLALTEKPAERFGAIKTNAIPWCLGIMNIAPEFQVSRRISFELPLWYAPWFQTERHALRVAALQPGMRWWLRQAGEGHFFGPHIDVAWYNMKNGDFRYQDRGRPAIGAGITYGYSLHLRDAFHIEFSIGAGWLSLRYDRFHNVSNGAHIDLRQTSYFGIDHAGITFSYRFPL